MKQMMCPLNGLRNISEFSYGGEFEVMPDPSQVSDENWSKYVFYHENAAAVVKEWWCHTPTSYWFIAERDTVTDEIHSTYDANAIFTKRVDFNSSES